MGGLLILRASAGLFLPLPSPGTVHTCPAPGLPNLHLPCATLPILPQGLWAWPSLPQAGRGAHGLLASCLAWWADARTGTVIPAVGRDL